MKSSRIYLSTLLAGLTIVIFTQCGDKPVEHGTEYLLRVADGTDTAETRKAYLVIENRLKNFGLDGDYEITMANTDIRVRIREGVTYDRERLRNLLQASAGLTFRATYTLSEIADEINEAHATFLRMNHIDSANAAGAGLAAYLMQVPTSDPRTPFIGYCLVKDTAKVNTILRTDSIATLFPSDLVFHWGKGMTSESGQPSLVLVACKSGRNYEMSGEHVASASTAMNTGNVEISIMFDQSGIDEWAKMTKANIGRSIAIELSNFVYGAPTVNSEITGGQAVITGNFTTMEADDLVKLLSSGDLPADFRIVEEKTF